MSLLRIIYAFYLPEAKEYIKRSKVWNLPRPYLAQTDEHHRVKCRERDLHVLGHIHVQNHRQVMKGAMRTMGSSKRPSPSYAPS